jgi:hypothetical protein
MGFHMGKCLEHTVTTNKTFKWLPLMPYVSM